MPTHILVNKLGLTYKSTIGLSTATLPDVCKTPTPGGPVPIPYPNFANQGTLAKGTKTVKAKNKMIAVKGSRYAMSTGDEPGTLGGVKSSTFKQHTDWITYSFDVKMDGKNACRHTDKKFHNKKNTVNLAGGIDPAVPVEDFPVLKRLCEIVCDCFADPPVSNRGREYQGCVTKKIRDLEKKGNSDMPAEPFYDMNQDPPELIMSSSQPRRTGSGRRASKVAGKDNSRSPDVAIVKDTSEFPIFDNLSAIVEIKFGPDEYTLKQRQFDQVFEDDGVEVILLSEKSCGCVEQ